MDSERGRVPGGRRRVRTLRVMLALILLVVGCRNPTSKLHRISTHVEQASFTTTEPAKGPRNDSPPPPRRDLQRREVAAIHLALAEEQIGRGFDEEAVAQLEQARRIDPELEGVSHRLALLYDRQGKQRKAQQEYLNALKQSPDDPSIHNDLGYSYYTSGDWVRAEESFRQAVALDGGGQAWNNLGMALGQQGDYEGSLEAFRKATDDAGAHNNLGFVFLTQGKYENALYAYRRALELDPDHPRARELIRWLEGRLVRARADRIEAELGGPVADVMGRDVRIAGGAARP